MFIKTLVRSISTIIVLLFGLQLFVFSPGRAELSAQETPSAPTTTISLFFPVLTNQDDAPAEPPTNAIIVDHTSVELFDRIPQRYLTAARNLRLLFSDRSVGENIHEALNCLTATSWDQAPAHCRVDYIGSSWEFKTFGLTDWLAGNVPDRILFDPDPVLYNRSNWTFEFRGGTWSQLTQDFIQTLAPSYINSKDVLSYQFSYLNIDEMDDIDDPQTGYFANNPNKYDIYDLEAYIAQHPNKIFFLWTTSLARGVGSTTGQNFNNQMRQYARDHNKILFDVADIQSRTDLGSACYDNRDGVQYCGPSGECENYPNDHQNLPAICQDYTTEINGGHLGSVAGGKIQIAKAFWVLMSRIAGWDGQSQ
jgi:hypothetical protein